MPLRLCHPLAERADDVDGISRRLDNTQRAVGHPGQNLATIGGIEHDKVPSFNGTMPESINGDSPAIKTRPFATAIVPTPPSALGGCHASIAER